LVRVLLRALDPWDIQRVPSQEVGIPDHFATV